MAKGQVTSETLATGIKGFGGLSSLGGTPRPVRDNPFRDTRSEPPTAPVAAPPAAPAPNPTPVPEAEPLRLEVIKRIEEPPKEERGEPHPPVAHPAERKPIAPRAPKQVLSPPSPRRAPKAAPMAPTTGARERKLEVYNESVTLPVNAEMRDRAEALARELHRRRDDKSERITTNTVLRVAVRAFLDTFHLDPELVINNESELYDEVVTRLGRK